MELYRSKIIINDTAISHIKGNLCYNRSMGDANQSSFAS